MKNQIKTDKYLYSAITTLVLGLIFYILRLPLTQFINNYTGGSDGEQSFFIYFILLFICGTVFFVSGSLFVIFATVNHVNKNSKK